MEPSEVTELLGDAGASAEIIALTEAALVAGTHRWLEDPEVNGVFGLINFSTGLADVILYCVGPSSDFEVGEDFYPWK